MQAPMNIKQHKMSLHSLLLMGPFLSSSSSLVLAGLVPSGPTFTWEYMISKQLQAS